MTRPLASLLTSLALWALVAAVAAAPALPAAPVDQPPAWVSLSKAQQAALGPLQRDWARIDLEGKQKWLEVAGRFSTMPAAERQRVKERMAEWARMTPVQRGQARFQFQETRQFSPADRQARWEAYKALPADERRELARRAKPGPKSTAAAGARASESSAKRNTLPPVRQATVKPVAPTLVQAKPGVTTSLMSAKPAQASHQQPGLPKIAATPGFVNPHTLLPRRGPQGAAVQTTATSDPASRP